MTFELNQSARTVVFQRRVKSLTHEMAQALYRSSRSPLINNGDFALGFLDARGRMLEQDEHLPLMAFSLYPGCGYLMDFFGGDIHDGDIFIHNDVWCANLQHADVGFYKPVFAKGELVAWTACRGHWADIGGAVKGTCNPEAVEVHQEALRIPPVKLWEKGRLRRDVWELIFANVRLRDIVEADAQAQLGSCNLGERRLLALMEAEGAEAFRANVERLYDMTERRVRAEVGALPDGEYFGESTIYQDEPGHPSTSKIAVKVLIRGDSIAFDYSGTDPQTPTFTNASLTSTTSATLTTLLYLLSPEVLHNHGLVRAVDIYAPEGSILNAQYPAATFMGNKLCQHTGEAIMLALRDALPERVTAPWGRRLSYRMTGKDPRNGRGFHDIFFLTYEGGGATHGVDGYNQPGLMGGGNVLAQDYETFEVQNPVHLLEHEYVTDSAGPGRWRGGLGTRTRVRYYGEETGGSTHGDGTMEPSPGILGGGAGTLNQVEFLFPDGARRNAHAMEIIPDIPPGTVSVHDGGGGGGYGPPEERDLERVDEDLRNGFISGKAAVEIYGAVLTPDGAGVDFEASRGRRKAAPGRRSE